MRRVLLVMVVSALGVASVAPADAARPTVRAGTSSNTERRVIVRLRTSAAETPRVTALLRGNDRLLHQFRHFPYATIQASDATIARLRQSPDVAAVVPDTPMKIADAQSTPLVGATAAQASFVNGAGQAVAVLDTGVDRTHPFLAGKVVDEACYSASSTCPNGRTSQTGTGAAAPCTYAPAQCLHGTHVAGIAVGGPAAGVNFVGVAPGAKLVAVQVFSRFTDPVCSSVGTASPCALTLNSDILAGLEHVFDIAKQRHVAAVNLSIGGAVHATPCDTNVLKPAFDALLFIGVATVVASGNNGSSTGIAEPGCISTAVTVGATTKADAIASFSNTASFLDLLAPGQAILSSVPGGGYAVLNGTSMAAPHVAGAFALGRQWLPKSTVTQLLSRFRSGAVKITDPRNGLTFPRLDVMRALGIVQIVPGTATATEGRAITIPVKLSRGSLLPVTARFQTRSGTATQGVDFTSVSGTVTFAPGTTSTSVTVQTRQDTVKEPEEFLFVGFSSPTNATIGGLFGLGLGGIIDND
jgi:subtilisin family serine protease